MTEIMMDGEPLKARDEVYCLLNGKGKVAGITINSVFPIVVAFSGGPYTYSKKFKGWSHQKNRTLYWQKPEIIPPPKPKKKVKVWDCFVQSEDGICFKLTALTDQEARKKYPYALHVQKIDGTEREVER